MSMIVFEIPAFKIKYEETLLFYTEVLKFKKFEIEGYFSPLTLVNEKYPNTAIILTSSKKTKHKYRDYNLRIFVEKNLPSICGEIKSYDVNVELVTDMCAERYAARFCDPSENQIFIYCNNLEDDSGESFPVAVID